MVGIVGAGVGAGVGLEGSFLVGSGSGLGWWRAFGAVIAVVVVVVVVVVGRVYSPEWRGKLPSP